MTNHAPETWITAAPLDTLTVKDGPTLISPGTPTLLPVRFHLYWAGADQDGEVTGFMVADTAMSETPLNDLGPKGLVWHWTTRTDSIFTFKTSFNQPDRVHTVYIYAMDDKGKADPTPARFTFRAFDRYPPIGVIDTAEAVGRWFVRGRPGLQVFDKHLTYLDTLNVYSAVPRDTVASGTTLRFRWHGEPRALGRSVSGYLYSIGNTIQDTLSQNQSLTISTLRHGPQTFTLYTVGESDWRSKATRFFQMNYAPDTWFTGPNLSDPQWTTIRDGANRPYYYRDVTWSGLPNSAGIANTLVSPDSVNVLPANRRKSATFLEVYQDRVWAHQAGDTVNLNSWVIISSGGFDPDSPYDVRVGVGDVTHPAGPVTTPGPPNGSPIGFHYGFTLVKPGNLSVNPSETGLYPIFDRLSVLDSPLISAYVPMTATGKVYFYTAAEDGDSTEDLRVRAVGGPRSAVDITFGDSLYNVRRAEALDKILVFYVNHAPYLKTSDGQFFPNIATSLRPQPSIQRGTLTTFMIVAGDIDPVDYTRSLPPGGPQQGAGTILTRNVDIFGKRDSLDAGGNPHEVDATYNVATATEFQNISFVMPMFFKPGTATVAISVCDYRPSDEAAGNAGRCSPQTIIPITITGPQPSVSQTGASQSISRPGSPATDGRRQQP